MTECKQKCGPGYASPSEAVRLSEPEKILYVTCTHANGNENSLKDYLAVVDVDEKSERYSQVVHRSYASNVGDEFHHSNWNTCSSCYDKPDACRNKLILPCLRSDRIYVYDTTNILEPKLFKVIENLKSDYKLTAPHSAHCLATGEVMISTMGDEYENAKGAFILLDGNTFDIKEVWNNTESIAFGYDFWYQPRHNIMVSSGWGAPRAWRKGFSLDDVNNSLYGTSLYFWNWNGRTLIKTIDLGQRGLMPLETRFFHNPNRKEGYVGCALSSTVFLFGLNESTEPFAKEVIAIPSIKVKNWALENMPSVITDILISMDDRYLFISNWIHGDIRQYDVSQSDSPKLVGQIFVGGCLCDDSCIVEDSSIQKPKRPFIKGKMIRGGPQMLQLSLDGKRLYVTTSLFSVWDKQFYPSMAVEGGMMLKIDVLPDGKGLKLNENFLVDFGNEPVAAAIAHEMRYPGGDCSSDIWL